MQSIRGQSMKIIHGKGRRKMAVAKATLYSGSGVVRINSQLLQTLQESMYKQKMMEPLNLAGETVNNVNIDVNVMGGGINSQAEASRLAIAKALCSYNKKLQKEFLEYDRALLVADVRRKEPRKPNRHGKARSKTQKSYR